MQNTQSAPATLPPPPSHMRRHTWQVDFTIRTNYTAVPSTKRLMTWKGNSRGIVTEYQKCVEEPPCMQEYQKCVGPHA